MINFPKFRASGLVKAIGFRVIVCLCYFNIFLNPNTVPQETQIIDRNQNLDAELFLSKAKPFTNTLKLSLINS